MPAEEVFAALAAPQRQEILRIVRDEAQSVGAIAESCGASQQAVSHHLQVLKDAGLVEMQRDGRRHLYIVSPDGFESVSGFVAELWPDAIENLRDAVKKSKK